MEGWRERLAGLACRFRALRALEPTYGRRFPVGRLKRSGADMRTLAQCKYRSLSGLRTA